MGASANSDAEIVARVLAGERDLFHALVRRHEGPVWAVLRARVADRDEARELFQETWVRAFERLGALREPDRTRSWLLSIALNLCRERGRRPAARELADAADEPSGAAPVGAELERAELEGRLADAVARLPPRQREVVALRLSGELSHAAIAELLAITPESARANLYQGLRRVRSELKDWAEDER